MIEGYFTPHRNPHPWLDVAVLIDGENPDWVLIPFVVDTGAARTCIHAIDAVRRIGMSPGSLDPSSWRSPLAISGTAGSVNYLARDASFGFLQSDRSWLTFDGPILIGEMASGATPALLGWDLLRHFTTTVVGRPQRVTLEPLRGE